MVASASLKPKSANTLPLDSVIVKSELVIFMVYFS
jgi:hypothetical protein